MRARGDLRVASRARTGNLTRARLRNVLIWRLMAIAGRISARQYGFDQLVLSVIDAGHCSSTEPSHIKNLAVVGTNQG